MSTLFRPNHACSHQSSIIKIVVDHTRIWHTLTHTPHTRIWHTLTLSHTHTTHTYMTRTYTHFHTPHTRIWHAFTHTHTHHTHVYDTHLHTHAQQACKKEMRWKYLNLGFKCDWIEELKDRDRRKKRLFVKSVDAEW